MQYTVILVPDAEGRISVLVPAAPGCFSAGDTLTGALEYRPHWRPGEAELVLRTARESAEPAVRAAAAFALASVETPEVVTAGVAQALSIIDEMKDAGELPSSHGYELEVTTVDVNPAVAA